VEIGLIKIIQDVLNVEIRSIVIQEEQIGQLQDCKPGVEMKERVFPGL